MSTADAIGCVLDAALHARCLGDGTVRPADIARNFMGSVVKEDLGDLAALREYAVLVASSGAKDAARQAVRRARAGGAVAGAMSDRVDIGRVPGLARDPLTVSANRRRRHPGPLPLSRAKQDLPRPPRA